MSNRQDMGTDKIGLQFQPLVSEPRRVEDPRAFQPSTKERGLAMSGLSSLAEMIGKTRPNVSLADVDKTSPLGIADSVKPESGARREAASGSRDHSLQTCPPHVAP